MFTLTMMMMKPSDGDLSAAVEAILTADKGFVLDFTDSSVIWQDTAKTTPVTAPGDPFGAINTKYGTASPLTFPAATTLGDWTGTAWEGFGTDEVLASATLGTLANIPAITYVTQFNMDSLASNPVLIGWSTNSNTNPRIQIQVTSAGAVRIFVRRLDADATNSFSSASGLVSTGTTYTLRAEVDYAGTGDVEVWLDGTSIITGTMAGTPANTSNTNSKRCRFHFAISNGITAEVNGKVGRTFLGTTLLSPGDTSTVVEWVEEFAI